jgi:ATP-binding cassette subfamily B protein
MLALSLKQNQSLSGSISSLWGHIRPQRQRQFTLLLLLMIIASFAEVISIGSVIPFLAALTNPDKIFSNHLIHSIANILGLESPAQIVIPLTAAFCVFALLSGFLRLLLLKFSNRISFATGADLSIAIYEKTLYQPYMVHISRNTSEIINAIHSKTNLIIYSVILPILTIISASVMFLAIVSALIYVDPLVCLVATAAFGSIYILIAKQTKNKKIKNSYVIADQSTKIIKSLQEGLGGIRDVLIDGSQHVYLKNYSQSDLMLRKAQASNQFVGQSPRYVMESLGMILIALLAFHLFNREGGQYNAIPTLGILALGAQRLLPVMQQAYTAWSSIQGSFRSLEDTLDLLDQPFPSHYVDGSGSALNFVQKIELDNVGFKYAAPSTHVLSNLSLIINKGDRLGIMGVTGSGKSTLVDILMGLLKPTSGLMTVDGSLINHKNLRAWQKHIAHVPQSIFLADTSIAENIAFGVEPKDIDWARVRISAEKAQLQDVIDNLPDRYNTLVGERGIRLSGGQRQRIGIARALYKNADVFVFDEATSALDNQTEDSVMKAIDSLGSDITVIMIAHRLSTLKKCTKIIELADGKIVKLDSYENMVNPSK